MPNQAKGHSAQVAITLLSGEQKLRVAQIGNRGIMIRELSSPIPPGEALLLIRIDQTRKKFRIMLPEGIPAANRFAKFF